MPGDTTNKRTPFQREKDRKEIARRYLQGETQAAIGRALGLTQQMISYDLARIREQWRAAAVRDIDELQAHELAKIDQLEVTYWQAWQRSLEDSTTRTQYVEADKAGKPTPARAAVRTEQGTGDPRWLAGVQWCIERRCKLLGLDKPQRVDVTTDGQPLGRAFEDALDRAYGADDGTGDD